MLPETLLLVKICVSIGLVLVLSFFAEVVGSKWAGIVAGLPTGSAISLYFYGLENGVSFAGESALYNMIGLVAMQAFIFGYYSTSKYVSRPGVLLSTFLGFILYTISIIIISFIPVTPIIAVTVSVCSFVVFIRLFRNIEVIDIKEKQTLTFRVLTLRAIISASIIVLITTIAYLVGSKWSGLFSAFPTTLFPLLLIIHLNYGKQYVDSIIKYVPKGLGGLLIYSLSLHLLYKFSDVRVGIGVVIAFGATLIYLIVYNVFERKYH